MIIAISPTGLKMEFPTATTWGWSNTGTALTPSDGFYYIKKGDQTVAYVPMSWVVTTANPTLSDPVNGLTTEKALKYLLEYIKIENHPSWGTGSLISKLKKSLQDFDSRTSKFKNQ